MSKVTVEVKADDGAGVNSATFNGFEVPFFPDVELYKHGYHLVERIAELESENERLIKRIDHLEHNAIGRMM